MMASGGGGDEKADMRAAMKRLLGALDRAAFIDAGNTAAARLIALPLWRKARAVCVFLSMNKEIDTSAIIRAASAEGKTLCFPRTEGDALSFRFSSSAGPWSDGPFGIREPAPEAPVVDFSLLPGPILVIVPGLAFDGSLMRLGRGKGYYDRFLRSLRTLRSDTSAVGIALRVQAVGSVPVNELDQRLDAVLYG